MTELHPASRHLDSTVAVMLYRAGGFKRTYIMTSLEGCEKSVLVSCTLMASGGGGAIM